jgi:hypothetical protein
MSEQEWECVEGGPCWVNLVAHDLAVAQRFYGALLSWTFHRRPEQLGPYVLGVAGGVPVAGLTAAGRNLLLPVSWTAFFATRDADKSSQAVREAGGTVAVGPLAWQDGRMVLAADPLGAVFGIWQGPRVPGWRLGRSVGIPTWIELQTRDAFQAAVFYGEVFGWDSDPEGRHDVGFENDRVVLRIDGRPVASLRGGADESAPELRIRPRWDVYFTVLNVDGAAGHAEQLGGGVVCAPSDSPYGRIAALRDPEGALFSVAEAAHG